MEKSKAFVLFQKKKKEEQELLKITKWKTKHKQKHKQEDRKSTWVGLSPPIKSLIFGCSLVQSAY